jgi:hypothetical protein
MLKIGSKPEISHKNEKFKRVNIKGFNKKKINSMV